jgi:hypothetical protein
MKHVNDMLDTNSATRIGSGELLCWPTPAASQSGTIFRSMVVGAYGAAIVEDGYSIVTWTPVYNNDNPSLPDPITVSRQEGGSPFRKLIGLPPWNLCAIQMDDTARCYLSNPLILPDEPFIELSADFNNVCGIKKFDNTLWCSHDISVPQGQYSSLSCGRYCVAIALNGSLILWPNDPTSPPPTLIQQFIVRDATIGLYGSQLCFITLHDNITHCYDDDSMELPVPPNVSYGVVKLTAAGSGFTCMTPPNPLSP